MRHLALINDLMYQALLQHFLLGKSNDAIVDIGHISSQHDITLTSAEVFEALAHLLNSDLIPEGANAYLDDTTLDQAIADALGGIEIGGAGAVVNLYVNSSSVIFRLSGPTHNLLIQNVQMREGVHVTTNAFWSWGIVSGEFLGVPEENVRLKVLKTVNYVDGTINNAWRTNTGGADNTEAIFLVGELRSSGSYQIQLASSSNQRQPVYFCSADEFEADPLFYSDAKLLELGGVKVTNILNHIDTYPHFGIVNEVVATDSVLSSGYMQNWTQNLLQPSRDDYYWDGAWRAGLHESLLAEAGSEWLFTGEGHVKDAVSGVILVEPVNNGKLLGTLHPTSDVMLELVGNVMARKLDHFSCTMDIEVENA